jgi:hypothetical protein
MVLRTGFVEFGKAAHRSSCTATSNTNHATDKLGRAFISTGATLPQSPISGRSAFACCTQQKMLLSKFGRVSWTAVNEASIVRQQLLEISAVVGKGVIASPENDARSMAASRPVQPLKDISSSLLG